MSELENAYEAGYAKGREDGYRARLRSRVGGRPPTWPDTRLSVLAIFAERETDERPMRRPVNANIVSKSLGVSRRMAGNYLYTLLAEGVIEEIRIHPTDAGRSKFYMKVK